MSYTTAQKVADFTGGGVKATDIKTEWLEWADALIEEYCGTAFDGTTTYTDETYDGNGTDTLVLRHRPVVSVSSVKISDTALSSSAYKVYDWGIRLNNSPGVATSLPYQLLSPDGVTGDLRFPKGTQNIKVTYTAGRSTVPKEVEMAATMIVSKIALFSREGGGGASQRWSQAAVQYGDPNIGPGITPSLQSEVQAILRSILPRHRKIRLPRNLGKVI